jgi:hypothetical protein
MSGILGQRHQNWAVVNSILDWLQVLATYGLLAGIGMTGDRDALIEWDVEPPPVVKCVLMY